MRWLIDWLYFVQYSWKPTWIILRRHGKHLRHGVLGRQNGRAFLVLRHQRPVLVLLHLHLHRRLKAHCRRQRAAILRDANHRGLLSGGRHEVRKNDGVDAAHHSLLRPRMLLLHHALLQRLHLVVRRVLPSPPSSAPAPAPKMYNRTIKSSTFRKLHWEFQSAWKNWKSIFNFNFQNENPSMSIPKNLHRSIQEKHLPFPFVNTSQL